MVKTPFHGNQEELIQFLLLKTAINQIPPVSALEGMVWGMGIPSGLPGKLMTYHPAKNQAFTIKNRTAALGVLTN